MPPPPSPPPTQPPLAPGGYFLVSGFNFNWPLRLPLEDALNATLLEAYASSLRKTVTDLDPHVLFNVRTKITITKIVLPRVVTAGRRRRLNGGGVNGGGIPLGIEEYDDEDDEEEMGEGQGEDIIYGDEADGAGLSSYEIGVGASSSATSGLQSLMMAGMTAKLVGGPVATAVALAAAAPVGASEQPASPDGSSMLRRRQLATNVTIPGYADVNFHVSGNFPNADALPATLTSFFDTHHFTASPDQFLDRCPTSDHIPCLPGTHHNTSLIVTTHPDQCLGCPAGTECSLGTISPKNCSPGDFAAAPNSSACAHCPSGKFQDESGASSCKVCTPGHFCPSGSSTPIACKPGTVGLAAGATDKGQCQPVQAGFYAPRGTASPVRCPFEAFFYCPGAEADDVSEYPGSQPLMRPSAVCEPGTEAISQGGGVRVCATCRKGHYCLAGGISQRCPTGSWHNLTGQALASSCQRCPDTGVTCATGDMIEVHAGYYMQTVTTPHSFRCPYEPGCLGGKLKFGDYSCKTGHSDLLCGKCIDGWYRSRGRCISCASIGSETSDQATSTTMLAVLMALSVLGVCIVLYVEQPPVLSRCERLLARSRMRKWRGWKHVRQAATMLSGLFKIALSFSQCLGAISRFSLVKWPPVRTRAHGHPAPYRPAPMVCDRISPLATPSADFLRSSLCGSWRCSTSLSLSCSPSCPRSASPGRGSASTLRCSPRCSSRPSSSVSRWSSLGPHAE